MRPATSTKTLSYHISGSQEEFAHPHSLKIRSFLGGFDRSFRKDRFYRTAPILPKHPGSPATGLRRWSGNSQGPRRQAVPPARHQRQWPILFLNSISQSIGATRTPCLSLFPHSAGCSLDAPLMRRTLSCESLVFNRRIFSRLRASYGCGFHPEPTVSHARFNRLGRSATISRFNETPCRSYTSLPSGPAHGNRRALRRSSKPAPICVFVCGSV